MSLQYFDTTPEHTDSPNVTRSATFVIAASDSADISKNQADYVCDGVDDQVEIQAANDAANGGTVKLLGGDYNVSDLTIDDCTLEGEAPGSLSGVDGTTLNVTGTITVQTSGRLHNLRVVTAASYAGTAVKLTGYINRQSNVLDQVTIEGQDLTAGSIGLLLEANATDAAHWKAVAGSTFGSIIVENYETGVKFYTKEDAGVSYINGNVFHSLKIFDSKYLLTLERGDTASNLMGNHFLELLLQAGTGTVDGLETIGYVQFNTFNITVWDWNVAVAPGSPITLGTNSDYNFLVVFLSAPYVITDNGIKNIIIETLTGRITAQEIDAASYEVGGTAGADFDGVVTNITVVKGIVTAVS